MTLFQILSSSCAFGPSRKSGDPPHALSENSESILFMLRMVEKMLSAQGVKCALVASTKPGKATYLECRLPNTEDHKSIRLFYSEDELDRDAPWSGAWWGSLVRHTKIREGKSIKEVWTKILKDAEAFTKNG